MRLPASRAFREGSHARQMRRACAGRRGLPGRALRDGGGHMQVEAAHILPVEQRRPDAVRNGLALSGMQHGMFDRGLVSADADHAILPARTGLAAERPGRLLIPERRLILPEHPARRPAPVFLRWHREHVFRG